MLSILIKFVSRFGFLNSRVWLRVLAVLLSEHGTVLTPLFFVKCGVNFELSIWLIRLIRIVIERLLLRQVGLVPEFEILLEKHKSSSLTLSDNFNLNLLELKSRP